MHSCDILAYTFDGATYCPDCVPQAADTGCESPADHADENGACDENCHGYGPGPVFAESEEEVYGWTCDSCRACYVIGDGWTAHDDAVNPEYTRWATCRDCGAVYPYAINSYEYRQDRRSALLNRLSCPNCHGKPHF